jgi:glutamate synthase domain-containing protein 3
VTDDDSPAPVPVDEIRDYHRVNAEVARRLDRGATRVRLTGVEGQRLLLAGLRGAWRATVEIEGSAGPELAAGLETPGVLVVVNGAAADGAGRSLRSGTLLIRGSAGDGLGYRQAGGVIYALGRAGHRAGLAMEGGVLLLKGGAGRLAGERQSGGLIVAAGELGPFAGHGRHGGRLLAPGEAPGPPDEALLRGVDATLAAWIAPGGHRDA